MKISLSDFGGMAPKIEPRKLADRLALVARNTGFSSGALAAINVASAPSAEFSPLTASVRAIIRPSNDDTRLAFTTHTVGEALGSLVSPTDKWGRVYYGTPLGPRFTTGENYTKGGLTINPVSYRLGVKIPEFPPVIGTVAFTPEGGGETDTVRTAYAFTFVDKYGHEGAPSPVSMVTQLPYDAPFTCEVRFTGETLPETNVTDAVRRLYRATYDGSTSMFQYVADIPLAMATYVDSLPLGEESEAMVSTDWVPPPAIKEIASVASNFLVGYVGNMLCYSELRLPHAWPEQYRYPLKYQIVGMKPTQNGLLIATSGKPYWAFGADPASAVPVELDANHPCLSAASMVDMGGYVIYASTDGLIAVDGQDVKVLSEAFIDRYTWMRDFAPQSILAFAYEGRYVFSVGDDWWLFDPTDGGRGFSTLDALTVPPAALRLAYYDARRDTTVLLDTSGKAFDVISAEGTTFVWGSKVFETPPTSFSRARVRGTQYPLSLRIVTESSDHTYIVKNGDAFPIHGGVLCSEWRIEVSGGGRVTEVSLVQSAKEL